MKPFLLFAAVFTIFSAFSPSARSQTQFDLNVEAEGKAKKADEALNTEYRKLMATLDDAGKEKLKTSEREWIKFRDAECDFAADAYRGGSIMPLIWWNCYEQLTITRTTELDAHVKERAPH